MRIIQVGDYPEDENVIKGGIQSSVHGLTKELISREHSVCVISLPNRNRKVDRNVERGGLTIYYFANRARYNVLAVNRCFNIAKKISAYKGDVCHFHGTDLTVLLLYIYCRFKKIAAIITVHGLAYVEERNTYKRKRSVKNFLKYIYQGFFEFIILNIIKEVIVDTPYVADSFRKIKKKGLLFRLPTFHVIPQGINARFFELRDEYEKYKILSVGSIGERKGHLYLIKAFEKIIPDYPQVKLNIAGKIYNPKYFETLKSYLTANKLEEHIKIFTNLTFEDLTEYYKTSNIFALHSEEESQGIVFCEAMACGKPIVATNSGGIPDVVTNGRGGFLSTFSDIDVFAESVKRILMSDSLRNEFSRYNKENSLQYSWSVIGEKILNVYKNVSS